MNRTYRSNSPKVFLSEAPSIEEMEENVRNNVSGFDPIGRGEKAPGPTRTTSEPWAETRDRKPYMPVEDTSTPSLDEGVSFRQRICD